MEERLVKGRTLPEAYHNSLKELEEFGEISPCPDYNTNQKELSMTMVVEERIGNTPEALREEAMQYKNRLE